MSHCEDDFASFPETQFKEFCLPEKTICLSTENVNEDPGTWEKLLQSTKILILILYNTIYKIKTFSFPIVQWNKLKQNHLTPGEKFKVPFIIISD